MTFVNDQVTEQALGRLTENANATVRLYSDALDSARKISDLAHAAQGRGLRDSDLEAITSASLNMASAAYFASSHGDLVTTIVASIGAARTGAKSAKPLDVRGEW